MLALRLLRGRSKKCTSEPPSRRTARAKQRCPANNRVEALAGSGRMGPMPKRISARISAISESATLAVDAKAKALKAAGRPVIGFGAGEPDFPTPAYIVEAAIKAAGDPKYPRYTPVPGLPELREAVAAKTLRDSGYSVDAAQVLITNG